MDGTDGGRLIYYDFGMMGQIPTDVRSGLLELFYGVYQKDPDRCLDALVAMGVLVPGGDRTAVRRTAEFFLTSFQVRQLASHACPKSPLMLASQSQASKQASFDMFHFLAMLWLAMLSSLSLVLLPMFFSAVFVVFFLIISFLLFPVPSLIFSTGSFLMLLLVAFLLSLADSVMALVKEKFLNSTS